MTRGLAEVLESRTKSLTTAMEAQQAAFRYTQAAVHQVCRDFWASEEP